MKIWIRGVRGSIAVPGPETVKYGGNTTCIEIHTDAGEVIIIDAGTGIRRVGLELIKSPPVNCSILITHTHWDHIQGLPFFLPLFMPGNNVDFYGAFSPSENRELKEIISQQMQYCFFPVRENELKANLNYNPLVAGESILIGSAKVTTILMNHPVLNFGYKIEADGQSFFFSGDHEPAVNRYTPCDAEFRSRQAEIDAENRTYIDFIRDVDCVVLDSQYTNEEYRVKAGWGHGTYISGVELAARAGVSNLYLSHHDPERTDLELDRIHEQLEAYIERQNYEINLALAVEGTPLQLSELRIEA